jgi:hypothetical protein
MASPYLDSFLEDFRAKMPAAPASARGKKATWLLVACIDGRYPHVVHKWMGQKHPTELYDQINLAGASLGVVDVITQRPQWRQTMLDHIGLSMTLHPIRGVLILSHRTCGAFREFKLLTAEEENTPREVECHTDVSAEIFQTVLRLFRFRRRKGYVAVYLAPEVTDPRADDFPSPPIRLHEGHA